MYAIVFGMIESEEPASTKIITSDNEMIEFCLKYLLIFHRKEIETYLLESKIFPIKDYGYTEDQLKTVLYKMYKGQSLDMLITNVLAAGKKAQDEWCNGDRDEAVINIIRGDNLVSYANN